jgi:hypothetical protein
MGPNHKPVHALVYNIPSSVEQQFRQNKEIVGLVDIGILIEDLNYSSEWDFSLPEFALLRKRNNRSSY